MTAIGSMVNDKVEDFASYFRIALGFLKRKNPILNMAYNFLNSVQNMLMSRQRLKLLKHRVKVMHYRIYSMEKMIQDSNPHNFKGGNNLNQLR